MALPHLPMAPPHTPLVSIFPLFHFKSMRHFMAIPWMEAPHVSTHTCIIFNAAMPLCCRPQRCARPSSSAAVGLVSDPRIYSFTNGIEIQYKRQG